MPEIAYYFNAYTTPVWLDPDNLVDGNIITFAASEAKKTVQVLTGNNCPGTDLGTITKVELRVFAYGDGDDRIDITPIFTGGDGDTHQTVPVVSPGGWSPYRDITSDTNHPDWSLWSQVQDLDCRIDSVAVKAGHPLYCAKVEIRVTYTPPPPEAPTNLSSPSQTETTIGLTWTLGDNSDKTLIRVKEGGYPTSITDGYQAYFDTGESVTVQSPEDSKIQELFDAYIQLRASANIRAGERVNAFPVANISRVSFRLRKFGLPTGTAYIRIRRVSDDSILATITEIDVSTLATPISTWYDFDCDVHNPTVQDLRFIVEYDGGDADNAVRAYAQMTDVLAGAVFTSYAVSWNESDAYDSTIKIYYSIPLKPATTYYFRAWGYQSSTELYSEETADLTQATSGGVTHELAGVIAGVASVSGAALITRALAGIITGVASVSGLPLVAYRLSGISQGAAGTTGLVCITRWLAGLSQGASLATASLITIISLSGTAFGIAIVTGLLFPAKLVTRILHVRHPALLSVIQRRGDKTIREYHDLSSLDEEYLTKQVGLDVAKGDEIEATTLPGITYHHKV